MSIIGNMDLSKLKRGAVLRIKQKFFGDFVHYYHYFIYAGGGEVIHISKREGHIIREDIGITDLYLDSVNGQIEEVVFSRNNVQRYTKKQSYRRAVKMVGKKWDYSLFDKNCEHFATWCRTGMSISSQASGSRPSRFNSEAALIDTESIVRENNHLGLEVLRTYDFLAFFLVD